MSKSLGNVISPLSIVEEYGTDALRLFLARHVHPFEDSDVTMERFKEAYNADLANGLGNLAARIMKLAETNLAEPIVRPEPTGLPSAYTDALHRFSYNEAADHVWALIADLDKKLTDTRPFTVVKTDPDAGKQMIAEMCAELYVIARLIQPFMPATSDALKAAILANKKPENLFPRKE
jgi:methionyl-tRNA synthetase